MIASMETKSLSVAVVGEASTYLSLKTLRPLFSIAPMLKDFGRSLDEVVAQGRTRAKAHAPVLAK